MFFSDTNKTWFAEIRDTFVDMDKTNFEKMVELWHKAYYTKLILILCIFTAIIIGIKFYRKEKIYTFFLIYISLSVLFILGAQIITILIGLYGRSSALLEELCNTIFALVEFSTFYYFFLKVIDGKIIKLFMRILIIPFFLLC